jgi:mannose-1-phosphate guanylyltransferase
MRAVLLSAGLGTRLAPLTHSIPKILAPLGGRPLLEHQLVYLEQGGVTDVAVNVHHHAEEVIRFLETSETALAVRVSHEPRLLGTAGALLPLRDFLTEPFLVLYGDVVTDADLADFIERHLGLGGLATLAYYRSTETAGKGLLSLGSDGRVTSFAEKPETSDGSSGSCVSAGLYALSPEALAFVRRDRRDFGHDVWPAMLAEGAAVYGYELHGYVRDVGSVEALEAANRDLVAGAIAW